MYRIYSLQNKIFKWFFNIYMLFEPSPIHSSDWPIHVDVTMMSSNSWTTAIANGRRRIAVFILCFRENLETVLLLGGFKFIKRFNFRLFLFWLEEYGWLKILIGENGLFLTPQTDLKSSFIFNRMKQLQKRRNKCFRQGKTWFCPPPPPSPCKCIDNYNIDKIFRSVLLLYRNICKIILNVMYLSIIEMLCILLNSKWSGHLILKTTIMEWCIDIFNKFEPLTINTIFPMNHEPF